jgi:acetylornithine deacetylase/succinyl-diaminopimelate desuccinylase-like protein
MTGILDTSSVEVRVDEFHEATESEVDTEFYSVVERAIKEGDPKAIVAPFMVPGATDSRFLRRKGITCYGLMPLAIPQEEVDTIHGVDERISIEAFEIGLKMTCEIVRNMCV